jgi:hypothetical protein
LAAHSDHVAQFGDNAHATAELRVGAISIHPWHGEEKAEAGITALRDI